MNKKTSLIPYVLIIALGFAVYANSLKGDFLWDDEGLIKENRFIRNYAYIKEIFLHYIGAGNIKSGADVIQGPSYRPVQMCTYLFDYSIWKLKPLGYHLTNIILHTLVALCIYRLIMLLFGNSLLALLTSLFFVVHPIHTEAVAYISGRADSLAALFILLTVICYLKLLCKRSKLLYLAMLLCCILALFSRENSIMLPFLILLYHLSFKVKIEPKQFTPIPLLVIFYIILRITLFKPLLAHTASAFSIWNRVPGFFAAVTDYIRLLFLPLDLHMEYGDKLFSAADPRVIVGIIISAGLLICAYRTRNTSRLISFAVLWFFLLLLPSSNLYPIMAYMAEHWLYLPSIGFFLLLAKGLSHIYQTRKEKSVITAVITTFLLFYALLTVKQNTYWAEPIKFYKRAIQYSPESPRLYFNLANRYKDAGKHRKAIEFYNKTLDIVPGAADVYVNRGVSYSSLGEYEYAIADFKKALEIEPHFRAAIHNLKSIYKSMDKHREAGAILGNGPASTR